MLALPRLARPVFEVVDVIKWRPGDVGDADQGLYPKTRAADGGELQAGHSECMMMLA
jgi:hypothetical protein